ncbi:hypothetical protein [Pedobacter heparinus]|uniref:hypothetical protein n=1 Tax=Pedobacter heparinus TaxID=984 RepID=UPI00293008D2|nr:hypothetical protein [Pedobacter heparinus]
MKKIIFSALIAVAAVGAFASQESKTTVRLFPNDYYLPETCEKVTCQEVSEIDCQQVYGLTLATDFDGNVCDNPQPVIGQRTIPQ